MTAALPDRSLDQIFRSAHTPQGWTDRSVEDATVRQIYDLMKWGATYPRSSSPARFVWVRSDDEKAKLAGLAAEPNKPKILKAPRHSYYRPRSGFRPRASETFASKCRKSDKGAKFFMSYGAGEGNRTLVCSLGSCRSTIELRPRSSHPDLAETAPIRQAPWPACSPGRALNPARNFPGAAVCDGAMIPPGWGCVCRGVGTRYSTRRSADAASHGAMPALLACSCPRRARSKPGGGCFSYYPDARELRPPLNVEIAIEGIVALLRGQAGRSLRRHARYDRHPGLQPAGLRVRADHPARRNPHLWRGRRQARASGAAHSVAQAIAAQSVHDHRALPSRARGRRLCRQDFAERRQHLQAPAAVDRGRAAAPAARPCSTCCFRLLRRARRAKIAA